MYSKVESVNRDDLKACCPTKDEIILVGMECLDCPRFCHLVKFGGLPACFVLCKEVRNDRR
jgi:hypothetical protein